MDLPKEVWNVLAHQRAAEAQKTDDVVQMIEAILLATEKQLPAPPVAVRFIAERFRRWHDSQATITLDEAFGLKPARGQMHPYKAKLLQDRNEMLFTKIAVLKAFRVSTEDAAAMVIRGFEEVPDWNQSRWELPKIGVDRLLRLYFEWPARREMEEQFEFAVPNWPREDSRTFLSLFPRDSWPSTLSQFVEDRDDSMS